MSVEPPQPPADELDWSSVLVWLPRFETPSFRAGGWSGGEEESGVTTMPWVTYGEDVSSFIDHLYTEHVVAGFDWNSWMQERGSVLWDDPGALSEATRSRSAGCF